MLQTMLTGYTLTQYAQDGIEHIDVIAPRVRSSRTVLNWTACRRLTIVHGAMGIAVPLSQIARLTYEYEESDLVAAQSR